MFDSASLTLVTYRWDSSDPDRAPPPLPLNPSLPNASPTKHNTSAVVAAAAQALVDKARESAASPNPYNSSYWNEKSNIKTPQHKRLQSLQNVSIKDFGRALESRQSMDNGLQRSLSKSSSAVPTRDVFTSPPERNASRSGTPTPTTTAVDPGTDFPRSTRPPPRPLFGENSPSSSTVLTMQNMQLRDFEIPMGDMTNTSVRTPQSFDSIYSQMQNLTAIATTLQKEMTALSRRSKDNATDLISLKEATQSRDEDIRKSLREIVNSVRTSEPSLLHVPRIEAPRSSSAMAYLESQPFSTPPQARTITLPKIPSVHNFDFSPESQRSAIPHYSLETSASVAMLEKIIRDMGTKDGQERLLSQLSAALTNAGRESAETAYKVGQVLEIVREKPFSQALVRQAEQPQSLSRNNSVLCGEELATYRADKRDGVPLESVIVNGEFLKVLQKVKDSVTQSGGITGEVKSLVKELRGEVLGMGREIGRKLEEAGPSQSTPADKEHLSREDVAQIVSEGLAELREQMDQVIQAKRRQSTNSVSSRGAVDCQEIYDAIKHALAEQGYDRSQALQENSTLDREAILVAVKEAYEAYKPEIELQQFGLERDEILQCLKEGLADYQSSKQESTEVNCINRDEVMDAVQEALQYFTPPKPSTEAAELKEEILMAVRESLEQFASSSTKTLSTQTRNITRHDVLDAVLEGLSSSKDDRATGIIPEDIAAAVKAGLNDHQKFGYETIESLEGIAAGLQSQFKQLSESCGADTEQILTALDRSLMSLRTDIETYVDRSQDVTGRDEIIQTFKDGLEDLRSHISAVTTHDSPTNEVHPILDLLGCMKDEIESLHQAINFKFKSAAAEDNSKMEIFSALTAGFAELRMNDQGHTLEGFADENQEALKSEFDHFLRSVLESTASQKEEVLDAIQDGVAAIHSRLLNSQNSTASTDDAIVIIRQELSFIKDSLLAPVVRSDSTNNMDSILEAVTISMDGIRTQISEEQIEANSETLGLIKEELEKLRHSLHSVMLPVNTNSDKTEIIDAIQAGMESMRAQSIASSNVLEHAEAVDRVREELESLRQTIGSTLVQTGARIDADEVMDGIRVGLDDLRLYIDQKVEPPQSPAARSGEMLGTLNEILDSLRVDFANLAERPADTTVSYEILDTLKDGLADLRSDIEQLKSLNENVRHEALVLATADSEREAAAENLDSDPFRKADLQKLEVQLAQLQIKVEALGLDIRNSFQMPVEAEPVASKADIGGIDTLLRELQGAVALLTTASLGYRSENAASKDDTHALETLMQNTKAKIDDAIIPALNFTATKDDLDAVEVVVRLTNESIDNLAGLLQEAKTQTENGGVIAKVDLDIVAESCREILEKLTDLPSTAPSKIDVEQLTELLLDFRQSHESQKERYEKDIGVTARAFDDRKAEFKAISEQLEGLKSTLEEAKDEVVSKVKGSNQELKTLDKILQGLEQKIHDSPNAMSDVQALKELVTEEFEKAQARLAVISSEQADASSTIIEKQDELKAIVFAEILNRLDDRLDSMTIKFEEQQSAAEKCACEAEEKAAGREDIFGRSHTLVEDLKLTIDTLGATITGITPALAEATEKMTEDSKVVYNRVDDLHTKVNDVGLDNKTEHQLTRNEVLKSLGAIGHLHEHVSEFQPKFMDTLASLAAMLEQHFDHTKRSEEKSSHEIKVVRDNLASIESLQSNAPMGQANSISTQDDILHRKVDELLAREVPDALAISQINKKLAELAISQEPPDVTIDLDGIEEIQHQITTSAGEISAFLEFQKKLMTAQQQSKEYEVQDAAVEVARYAAEKNSLELTIVDLQDVKHGLKSDVASLQSEKEMLTAQKSRLGAEVSSLETALRIRREELEIMDARADALERRIIEGVMDHSKALLMTKATKTVANMDLKRVNSNATSTVVPTGITTVGVNMALKAHQAIRHDPAAASRAGRRILSLGQITSNVPRGGSALSVAPSRKAFASQMKRSQSVKQVTARKSSWVGQESLVEHDKENAGNTGSSDVEPESHDATSNSVDFMSRPTTRSQLSRNTTSRTDKRLSSGTEESEYTYATGSYLTGSEATDRTTSYGSTVRSTVGARSSLADDVDRSEDEGQDSASDYEEPPSDRMVVTFKPQRLSDGIQDEEIMSATRSEDWMRLPDLDGTNETENERAAVADLVVHRPGYDSGLGPETQVALADVVNRKSIDGDEKDMRREGYDSGLGSDLPTATLSVGGSDYFKRTL